MDINDDEVLMEQLRAALAGAEVSPEHRRAAQGAFAWRTIDEELLALSYDSWVEAQVVVRAAAESPRMLSFEGGGIQLEVELANGQLTGQLMPARACQITVQTPAGPARMITVDASGFFEVAADIQAGPVRFRIEFEEQTLSTPWLV